MPRRRHEISAEEKLPKVSRPAYSSLPGRRALCGRPPGGGGGLLHMPAVTWARYCFPLALSARWPDTMMPVVAFLLSTGGQEIIEAQLEQSWTVVARLLSPSGHTHTITRAKISSGPISSVSGALGAAADVDLVGMKGSLSKVLHMSTWFGSLHSSSSPNTSLPPPQNLLHCITGSTSELHPAGSLAAWRSADALLQIGPSGRDMTAGASGCFRRVGRVLLVL